MDDFENKISQILSNPEMMAQISALAQTMQPPEASAAAQQDQAASEPHPPQMDMQMLQKLSGLATQAGIDKNQRNLLNSISPYISQRRIVKLEKAMQAARMARLASGFLGGSGLPFLSGR